MPGRDDSTLMARGSGRRMAARRVVWAVTAIGVPALAASGMQVSDPAVARILQELQTWEDEPVTMAKAQAQAGDPAAARATLQRAVARADEAGGLLEIEKVQAEMGDRDSALKTLLRARDSDLVGSKLRTPKRLSVNGRFVPPDVEFEGREANRQISITLSDIAIEQFRLGDRTAAEATFQQALRSAKSLAPEDRGWAVGTVIAKRAGAGDFEAALNDVASIDDRAERFEALTQIDLGDRVVDMRLLERIIRMIEADGVTPEHLKDPKLKEERVHSAKIEALIAMAHAQAAVNNRAEAAKTFQRARRTAEAAEEEDTRYFWLGRIARALVKIGDAAEASQLASAIGKGERNWKLIIRTTIAEAHAEIGDPANQKAWDEALGAAETDTEKVRLLRTIANAQLEAGDREATLRTLEKAVVAVRSMNPKVLTHGPLGGRDLVESSIAVIRAKAGDITGAIRLAGTIEHIQIQGAALAGIAGVQADSGDVMGALETAGRIRQPDPKQGHITHLRDQWYALPKIITAQARASDVAGALATADRLGPSREARRLALISLTEGLHQRNHAEKHKQQPLGP